MVAFNAPRALTDDARAGHQAFKDFTSGGHKNVSDLERFASVTAGALIMISAFQRRPLTGLLLGGLGAALVYRGVTGHCGCYQALGVSTRREEGSATAVPARYGFKYEKSLVINRKAEDLFDFWRNVENLPRIMPHLSSVRDTGGNRSHWVATGPLGIEVEWDAEIYNEDPGRMIAWRSLPGGEVDTAGSVHFEEHGPGRGTEVRVSLKYNPPLGQIGANLAWLMGSGAEQEIDADLRRFRQRMEGGVPSDTRQGVLSKRK